MYEGLKEDYLAGHFVPGKKIDIQDLATRYRSSKTPVREAAFILVGEGLLAHHTDGGFLVPVREPAELIELLAFHMQMMAATLSNLRESAIRGVLLQVPALGPRRSPVDVASLATDIFASLAEATGNHHASLLIRRLNERLHYARIAEAPDSAMAEKELATIVDVNVTNLSKATRRRIEAYHVRKIAHQQKIIQMQSVV
ncbi:GntR family transcriptional regulator [Blastomonas sp. CCH13-E1]|uniref:GntR family transcriptional regulator n=1 Tax=Blastomonas sp. CCH13-E1 TaxID=1768739 RepID=UPI0018D22658|nr:GntR family transcriptional regulator [Blastomonas sp. CCH13-E1]